jgi:uncharacterized protein (TIGR03000 family)
MFRIGVGLVALLMFATVGSAQPRPRPRPPITPPIVAPPAQFPLAPGVMPGSPWGPGMPFQTPSFLQPPPGSKPVFVPVASPFGFGFGNPFFSPWAGIGYGFGGYGYAVEPQYLPSPAPEQRGTDSVIPLAREFPATLTLQFPAAAEVWLNGKKLDGEASEERVITSPVLKMNEKYTFEVKARWKQGGKTYEAKREVAVGSGDRSRLFIVSGEEVKE